MSKLNTDSVVKCKFFYHSRINVLIICSFSHLLINQELTSPTASEHRFSISYLSIGFCLGVQYICVFIVNERFVLLNKHQSDMHPNNDFIYDASAALGISK